MASPGERTPAPRQCIAFSQPASQRGHRPVPKVCETKRTTLREPPSDRTQEHHWSATSALKLPPRASGRAPRSAAEASQAFHCPESAEDSSRSVDPRRTLVDRHTGQEETIKGSRSVGLACEISNSGAGPRISQDRQSCQRCLLPTRLWLRHTCRTAARSLRENVIDAARAEDRQRGEPAAGRSVAQQCPSSKACVCVPCTAERQGAESSNVNMSPVRKRPQFASRLSPGARGSKAVDPPQDARNASLSQGVASSSILVKEETGSFLIQEGELHGQASRKAIRAGRDDEDDTCGSTAASICSGPAPSESARSVSVSVRSAASVQRHVDRVSKRRLDSSSGVANAHQGRAATPLRVLGTEIRPVSPSKGQKIPTRRAQMSDHDRGLDEPAALPRACSRGVLAMARREQPANKIERSRQRVALRRGDESGAPTDVCTTGRPNAVIFEARPCLSFAKPVRDDEKSGSGRAEHRPGDETQARPPFRVRVPSRVRRAQAGELDFPATSYRSALARTGDTSVSAPRQESLRTLQGQRPRRSASAHCRVGLSSPVREGAEERHRQLLFTKIGANEKASGRVRKVRP